MWTRLGSDGSMPSMRNWVGPGNGWNVPGPRMNKPASGWVPLRHTNVVFPAASIDSVGYSWIPVVSTLTSAVLPIGAPTLGAATTAGLAKAAATAATRRPGAKREALRCADWQRDMWALRIVGFFQASPIQTRSAGKQDHPRTEGRFC